MIKLAAFDVDGTLVSNGEHHIDEHTKKALHKLKENGIALAIASGRPPFFVDEELTKDVAFDYFICANGMYVANDKREQVHARTLCKEDVESLVEDFVKLDDALMFQFIDAAYIYNGKKRLTQMVNLWIGRLDILKDERKAKARHLKDLPLSAVCKVDPKNIAFYRKKYPNFIFESFTEDHYDIYPIDNSKAEGIRVICKDLGIGMENVIAFGDNYNDVQMLEACGIGVAMGNANEEAKAVSDFVTKDCTDDGIYYACKQLKLI